MVSIAMSVALCSGVRDVGYALKVQSKEPQLTQLIDKCSSPRCKLQFVCHKGDQHTDAHVATDDGMSPEPDHEDILQAEVQLAGNINANAYPGLIDRRINVVGDAIAIHVFSL